ncbi:flavodoxin [Pediococcus damnosus]|uniref:flavodoxin n=1 Tax=Pediococcus damnosus TaxID=51663 RepID=UPI0009BC37E6|nr:flavodoxin [Pediococcus damnosus]
MEMGNVPVVVYFSHNGETLLDGKHQQVSFGNTEVVAKAIAQVVDGELVQLIPKQAYPVDYQATLARAKQEMKFEQSPEIGSIKHDFQNEDVIYLGYPIWWGALPMLIQTFLQQVDLRGKSVYPFCTHEGSGFGRSFQELQELLPESDVQKGLAVRGSRVTCAQCAVNNWLGKKGEKYVSKR